MAPDGCESCGEKRMPKLNEKGVCECEALSAEADEQQKCQQTQRRGRQKATNASGWSKKGHESVRRVEKVL